MDLMSRAVKSTKVLDDCDRRCFKDPSTTGAASPTRQSVQSFLNGKLRSGLAWRTVKAHSHDLRDCSGSSGDTRSGPEQSCSNDQTPSSGSLEESAANCTRADPRSARCASRLRGPRPGC